VYFDYSLSCHFIPVPPLYLLASVTLLFIFIAGVKRHVARFGGGIIRWIW
jgi:hypothetical protein